MANRAENIDYLALYRRRLINFQTLGSKERKGEPPAADLQWLHMGRFQNAGVGTEIPKSPYHNGEGQL